MLQSNLWFAAVPPANVPTPSPGYFALFISDGSDGVTHAGMVHKKDSSGVVSESSPVVSYTDEQAQDAVAAILSDSATVQFSYDDAGSLISASVPDLSITTFKIADGAVTTGKLDNEAVTTAKIADGAVVGMKIPDLSITTSKLDDGSISTVKLADGAVTNLKIVDGTVTSTKLADDAVSTIKLADNAVTNAKIDAAAVTNSKLADSSVSNVKLADGAVSNTKLDAGAVTNAKLGDGAVGTTKIADLSVTNVKLGPAAVDAAKLADGAVTTAKHADGSVTGLKIADGAVTSLKLGVGAVDTAALGALAVTSAKIAALAVDSTKIVDGAVTTAKHADGSVTNVKLGALAVDSAKLADAAVTAAKLGPAAVDTAKIADLAVSTAKLAALAVDASKLADLAVTNAKIAALAVDASKLADAAVTNAKIGALAVDTGKLATNAVDSTKIIDGAVVTAKVADAAITNAKLANMPAATFRMRALGAGTGVPIDGTAAQAKTALAIGFGDVSGLGTAAQQNSTAFEVAGAAAAAQAAAIAASQPLDADLTAIAALSTAAYGRSLLAVADAAGHTALLNTASTALKGLMSAADKAKLDGLSGSRTEYNVVDNGITTTNTAAANVTAWNALMASIPDNSEVFFPPGPFPYSFASTLNIPAGKHLRVAGASNQKSMVQITSATADFFTVSDWYNEFSGLKFTSSVTRTGGAAINSGNNVAVSVYDCDFAGMYDGIVYTGGVNAGNLSVVINCGFTATTNRGIVVDGQNANTIIDKVIMDGASGVQQVGLDLVQCGSVLVSSSDLIRSVNNLRFNPVSPNGVFSAYFVNTFFDTSPASSVKFTNTGNVQRVKFTNCWFSGSVIGCEFASTAATLPTAIDFINCDIFGNSGRGIYASGVQDFSVGSSRIAGNTVAGVEVTASAGSVTKFNLQNNAICPTAGFGGNGTGVLINAGNYGGYIVTGNDVRGNTTATITDSGSVASTDLKIVADNLGHLVIGSIGNLATTATSSIAGSPSALLTTRVPGRAVNPGQVFRVRLMGLSSSTGTVTFRVYVGANGGTTDTVAWTSTTSAAQVANARAGFDGLLTVRTIGATGTVQAEALGNAGAALLPTVTAAAITPTVNTMNPWFITLAVTTSLGSFTAHQAVVEAL